MDDRTLLHLVLVLAVLSLVVNALVLRELGARPDAADSGQAPENEECLPCDPGYTRYTGLSAYPCACVKDVQPGVI